MRYFSDEALCFFQPATGSEVQLPRRKAGTNDRSKAADEYACVLDDERIRVGHCTVGATTMRLPADGVSHDLKRNQSEY